MKISTDHLPLSVSSDTSINVPLRKAWVWKGRTWVLIRDMKIPWMLQVEKIIASHEYSYQSHIFDSHELLKVLGLAMFAMGSRWVRSGSMRTCIAITRMQTGGAWDCLQVLVRSSDNHRFQNKEKNHEGRPQGHRTSAG